MCVKGWGAGVMDPHEIEYTLRIGGEVFLRVTTEPRRS